MKCDKEVTEEIAMKTAIQIVGIVICLALLGMMNAWHNSYKHDKCVDMGGRFMLNTSDSNQSTCVLGN